MPLAISVNDLTKRYPNQKGARPALENLSISINEGTLFGLVGPDGAGKTTLMRILATVLTPTSGDVQVLGADVKKSPETIRKLIGYMPQNFSLYPDLSVMENLRFFADMQGVTHQEQETRLPHCSILPACRISKIGAVSIFPVVCARNWLSPALLFTLPASCFSMNPPPGSILSPAGSCGSCSRMSFVRVSLL